MLIFIILVFFDVGTGIEKIGLFDEKRSFMKYFQLKIHFLRIAIQ